MPSARVHGAIAKEINKDKHFDELLLRMGTVSPDCWRNMEPESGIKDKYLTHFWNFRIKEGQANDYQEFYLKYYNKLDNPFYFGYLIHLIGDQYWKTYIDPKFEIEENGIREFRLKNGEFHDNENWWGYFDSLKMQKQIAKIYGLTKFPINVEDKGTLNYVNTDIMPEEIDGIDYFFITKEKFEEYLLRKFFLENKDLFDYIIVKKYYDAIFQFLNNNNIKHKILDKDLYININDEKYKFDYKIKKKVIQ